MYPFTYHRPASLDDAKARLAASEDGRPLAGGMSLIPTMRFRLASCADLVDLNGIEALAGIERRGDGVRIGAMTRHAAVAASPEVGAAVPALAALAGSIGDVQVRNRGTVGGSICFADPAADYPAGLLGLGATVNTDRRSIAADDFFTGLYETALEDGEIVVSVDFPVPERAGWAKFGNQASRFAVVAAMVSCTGGAARVAVTGAKSPRLPRAGDGGGAGRRFLRSGARRHRGGARGAQRGPARGRGLPRAPRRRDGGARGPRRPRAMKPARFRYLRATSIDAALQALADDPDARVLAGGQSLIAMMNLRLVKPACLVDINRIPDLGDIREGGGGIAIGALARHNDVKHSALVAAQCPLLTEAYESIAHHTVRNRGTLGGNLCHADPSSEAPAVMIAVGAVMVLRSVRGSREVAAEDFFLGPYETARKQDEMLVEIRLPGLARDGWAFAEISNRHGDFAIAAVAATLRLADGRCAAARVVASGVGEHAARLAPAEDALTGGGGPIDDARIERAAAAAAAAVDPHSDSHADAAYRRDAIAALTRRTLRRAAGRCG